jgi:hypothetical protein
MPPESGSKKGDSPKLPPKGELSGGSTRASATPCCFCKATGQTSATCNHADYPAQVPKRSRQNDEDNRLSAPKLAQKRSERPVTPTIRMRPGESECGPPDSDSFHLRDWSSLSMFSSAARPTGGSSLSMCTPMRMVADSKAPPVFTMDTPMPAPTTTGALLRPTPRSAVSNPAGQHIMNEGLFGQTTQLSALAADCAETNAEAEAATEAAVCNTARVPLNNIKQRKPTVLSRHVGC